LDKGNQPIVRTTGQTSQYLCSRNYRQGKESCNARRLPKEKLEKIVVDHIKADILNNESLEKMAIMVNEEYQSTHSGLNERLDIIDAELRDVRSRLSRLYDAIETGKVAQDDISSRIHELKDRQGELSKAQLLVEAEMVATGEERIDIEMVKTFGQDLKAMIEEANIPERKAFLRSFIKRIEINGDQARVTHKLPLPTGKERVAVLPIETFGGAKGIRTSHQNTRGNVFSKVLL
jgi:site-specific DNA recombinase